MTEAEWLACTDARQMLNFLLQRGKASDRKLRLFAVSYCRHIREKHEAVEVAEQYADGLADSAELSRARRDADEYVWIHCSRGWLGSLFSVQSQAALDVVAESAADAARRMITYAHSPLGTNDSIYEPVPVPEPALLREIFGNPLRPVTVDPVWLVWHDGTVPRIARAIYDERGFDQTPILADALEDAGCENEVILKHCREPGEHVRGCWLIDALVGKE